VDKKERVLHPEEQWHVPKPRDLSKFRPRHTMNLEDRTRQVYEFLITGGVMVNP